ncbi:MAG: helix-turn-helix transcriptional regulator [Gammaproteobacteria bacterium]
MNKDVRVSLPQDGFVRLNTVLKVYPVSKTTWWEGVRKGKYPSPVKLGPKTTAWRSSDIRDLLNQAGG